MRGDASEEVEGSTSRHIQATPARAPGERRPNGACGDAAGSKRRRSVQRHSLGADSDPPASAVCGFEPPNGSALVRGRAAPVRVAFSTCIGEVLLRKHKQVRALCLRARAWNMRLASCVDVRFEVLGRRPLGWGTLWPNSCLVIHYMQMCLWPRPGRGGPWGGGLPCR